MADAASKRPDADVVMASANEPAAKRQKSDTEGQEITLGTHHGHFHADEALAIYLLRKLPLYKDAKLIRTRNKDPARSDAADYIPILHTVVDVGDEYSPERNRFDHHQSSFQTTFPGRPTKLSSAGLVYMHFGKTIIAQELSSILGETVPEEGHPDVEVVWRQLYESFIEAIDANDNGQDVYSKADLVPGAKKRFQTKGFSLAAVVDNFNLKWTDTYHESEAAFRAAETAKFQEASRWIGERFTDALNYYLKLWLPSRKYVETAFEQRHKIDPEGRVMVLERGCPWKEWLYLLEKKAGVEGQLLYVLSAENTYKGSPWRIQCVSESPDSFVNRKSLPAAWGGKRDQVLDEISSIPGCVFVHQNLFIGGHKNFEGVMEMAKQALKQ